MDDPYVRPATPQAMVHRLPDKPDAASIEVAKPAKFIVLIAASTEVAGKVQIAKSVCAALDCPLFQGDSLHETAAKAARVGAPARAGGPADERDLPPASGANELRYQRMWLSKMTRTGLLFPDESRPATSGFSGFGGPSSTSTSRRGSASSIDSSDDAGSMASSVTTPAAHYVAYANKPPMATPSVGAKLLKGNAALLVVTHPEIEGWHKQCIRHAVGEYDIGVIFVPLDEDQEPPMLKPLDPSTTTNFSSLAQFSAARKTAALKWDEEVVLNVDVDAKVEAIAEEIINGARNIMNA